MALRSAKPILAGLALLLALALAPAARADEAAPIYETESVNIIRLGLSAEAEASLEAEPKTYVKGTFSFAKTDGTPGGEEELITPAPIKAEIRLKGDETFEPLEGKAAFKIKFKKTERFLGLRKMTLNNMLEDPSMVHEALSYASFRASGVPASRTSFAYVYVNGKDFGVELNLETVDADLVEKHLGSFDPTTQHLYEAEDGTDVIPGDGPLFEVDEGEEGNIADLEALIAAVNSEGPEPWSTRVAPYADLAEMTAMWAVEKYTGHWDGYSGEEGEFQPNNYYIGDNAGGQFQMFPWGVDESFEEEHHLAFDGRAGVLFNDCLEDAACMTDYWNALDAAKTSIDGLDLGTMATDISALLKPWQELEQQNERFPFTLKEIEEGVEEAREFIASRPAEASAWLAANDPSVVPDTTIESAPSGTINDPTPSFSFSASKPNSSFQCSLDGAPFAACTSPDTLAALADGPHSFEVRATDPVGNTDPTPAAASFTIDTTPPQTSIDSSPPAASNDPTPSFSFSADDNQASFQCSLDGAPFAACTSPDTLAALADGPHSFEVRATDPVGNTDPTPAAASFTIDTTPPQTSIDSSPPAASNDPTPSFTFSADEPNSSFQCSLDGAPFAACTSPDTLAALADGPHSFEVRATDPVGNTDPTPAAASFTIDTTPPQTSIDSSPPAASNDPTPSFSFSADEPNSTFQCSLDGAPFAACASPDTLAALPDGPHSFEVRATDPVGNTDPTPAAASFTVDTTPPQTSITGKPPAKTRDRTPRFRFTSSEPGTFACSIDSKPFRPCSSPKTYGRLSLGTHLFQVKATDGVLNEDATAARAKFKIVGGKASRPARPR